MDAFKNTNGTISVVVLNTGSSPDTVSYSLSGTGTPNGATVTPFLTNASNDIAAQATTSVSGGAFTGTIPARSLETYMVGTSGTNGGNTVTVTNPGHQTTATGTAVSLQVHATDSAAGQALSYSATGPPGPMSNKDHPCIKRSALFFQVMAVYANASNSPPWQTIMTHLVAPACKLVVTQRSVRARYASASSVPQDAPAGLWRARSAGASSAGS